MSSRKAIPNKPFPKARYSSAFSSKIIVKDYVVAAYLSDRLFLAIGHIFIKDFLQRFLAVGYKKHGIHRRRMLVNFCYLPTR